MDISQLVQGGRTEDQVLRSFNKGEPLPREGDKNPAKVEKLYEVNGHIKTKKKPELPDQWSSRVDAWLKKQAEVYHDILTQEEED